MRKIKTWNLNFHIPLHYIFLTLLAVPFSLPLLWMLSTSLQPMERIYSSPPQWVPEEITTDNFTTALGLVDFPGYMINTVAITIVSMAGTVFSSSLVGFAFAVLPARGKTFLFGVLLASLMVPPASTLIPLFIAFSKAGWIDTYLPLVLPHFFANAFYVFLFRQYYRTVHAEMFESAEMDGCNPLNTYWRIALPLSRPAVAAVAVFAFIASWNDFLGPLIFINTSSKFTVSLGLSLFQGTYYTQLHHIIPLSLIAVLPIILIYVVAQRFLIQGMNLTGLRG